MVVGWQGTAYMAQVNNEQAGNGRHIAYSIPREGSLVWAENMVLLKDAPHPQQGYALIDYLLRPEVIARTSNYVGYPNGNQAALPLVERKLRENPAVYLSKENHGDPLPAGNPATEGRENPYPGLEPSQDRELKPVRDALEARERPEPEKSSEVRQDRRSRPSPGEALPRPSGRGLPSDPRPIDRDTSPLGGKAPGMPDGENHAYPFLPQAADACGVRPAVRADRTSASRSSTCTCLAGATWWRVTLPDKRYHVACASPAARR